MEVETNDERVSYYKSNLQLQEVNKLVGELRNELKMTNRMVEENRQAADEANSEIMALKTEIMQKTTEI